MIASSDITQLSEEAVDVQDDDAILAKEAARLQALLEQTPEWKERTRIVEAWMEMERSFFVAQSSVQRNVYYVLLSSIRAEQRKRASGVDEPLSDPPITDLGAFSEEGDEALRPPSFARRREVREGPATPVSALVSFLKVAGSAHRNQLVDHLSTLGLLGQVANPAQTVSRLLSRNKHHFAPLAKGRWTLAGKAVRREGGSE
jgi:hypothetical protein